MTREKEWERFDNWYAETGWKYVSSREGAFQVWLAACVSQNADCATQSSLSRTDATQVPSIPEGISEAYNRGRHDSVVDLIGNEPSPGIPADFDYEFISKRLARVARLAGVPMPDMDHKEIVECAGTILGSIACKLEKEKPSIPEGWTAIHLKTGNEYKVIGEAIDATNLHSNQLMVIYQRDGKTFVREAEEFQERFAAAPKVKP